MRWGSGARGFACLVIAAALAAGTGCRTDGGNAPEPAAVAVADSAAERATAARYDRLLAGAAPDVAGLTLFLSRMPKGGDLHHHYSGALYAETYVDWLAKLGYGIDRRTLAVVTDKALVAEQQKLPLPQRTVLSAADVIADDSVYRPLLMIWSDKDFANHSHDSVPPDQQFFGTFGAFGPVSGADYTAGLAQIRRRAIDENVSYVETMLTSSPSISDPALDARFAAVMPPAGVGTPSVAKQSDDLAARQREVIRDAIAAYDANADFAAAIRKYASTLDALAAAASDDAFTVRFQAYAVRGRSPSAVLSTLYSAFAACGLSPSLVGVNIVGPENGAVAMQSYGLHMEMFRVLRERSPETKLALHAGELALGMVPPEGLRFHVRDAVEIAGASRIGHGIDVPHEGDPLGLLDLLRRRDVTVEINLTSNEFILGVSGAAHPISLYRTHGVPHVISTDDAGVSRTTLTGEYVLLATRYRPSYRELKTLARASIERSFLDPADRERLLADLASRFASFEQEMAAAR